MNDEIVVASDQLNAAIKTCGGQLCKLARPGGQSVLWNADPAVWGSSAPVLFPIVGRLKNDEYHWQGNRYQMPGHGIVRTRQFEVVEQQAGLVTLTTIADAQTKQAYPFEFSLSLTFRVVGSRLFVDHVVQNNDGQPMPFGLGAHPAFALSLAPGATGLDETLRHEDWIIQFARPETLDLYALDGTLIGTRVIKDYLRQQTDITLTKSLFENDALIFKDIRSQQVALSHRQAGRIVSVDTGGAPHLGIWAKPGAAFVCIEPWHSYSDGIDASGRLEDKPALKWLDPGYSFDWSYAITVY